MFLDFTNIFNMLIDYRTITSKYLTPFGIIHIGGHWAEEAKTYYENGVLKTVWIEADPSSFEIMKQKLVDYPDAVCLNYCVSEEDDKQIIFNVSNNEGQSSSILELEYHKQAHPEVHYLSQISLSTKTVNSIVSENKIIVNEYNMLVADIQGAELLMLKGATAVIPQMDAIYLEVNNRELYKGCGLVEEIDTFLAGYGFKRVETEWCGDFGWGDALYVKHK
jgi:FkbM family methyltransferase